MAPDQAAARHYLEILRGWLAAAQAPVLPQLASSYTPRAHETLATFRRYAELSILVTVAMAYEGLDAPEVAALTHVCTRARLEQMIASATRVDPHGGEYDQQRALVFHPDDPLFADFWRRIKTE